MSVRMAQTGFFRLDTKHAINTQELFMVDYREPYYEGGGTHSRMTCQCQVCKQYHHSVDTRQIHVLIKELIN